MTDQKLRGIVVRTNDYLENDRLLTVLTFEEGTATIKARGVRKKGAKLAFASGVFFCGEFEIAESHGRYILTGARSLYDYSPLAEDIEKFYYACHFIDISSAIIMEKHPDQEMLRFLLNALHMLVTGNCSPILLTAIFELRAAVLTGFSPSVYECAVCGSQTNSMKFSVAAGGFVCCTSGTDTDEYIKKTIIHITEAEMNELFAVEIPVDSAKKLKALTGAFIETVFDRKFKTLEQLKDI